MEEQAFLSTLPLRIKNRRRRTSTHISSSKTDVPTITDLTFVNEEHPDRDSDETSSDEEPGTRRRTSNGVGVAEGTMTPTGHTVATGFVGLSCGKDAPNVHFVSPGKEMPDIFSRPDLVDGSRYYVKRRIKIGNTSKFIPEGTVS